MSQPPVKILCKNIQNLNSNQKLHHTRGKSPKGVASGPSLQQKTPQKNKLFICFRVSQLLLCKETSHSFKLSDNMLPTI